MLALNQTMCENEILNGIIDGLYNHKRNKMSEFQERDSGCSLIEKEHVEVTINKFQPIRG